MEHIKSEEKINEKRVVRGFVVRGDECIWMTAGVIHFRKCDHDFDCSSCPFDQAMQKTTAAIGDQHRTRRALKWAEKLKERHPGTSRPCLHTLTGRIDAPKICTMGYECYHCPFDQSLDQEDLDQDMSVLPACYHHTGVHALAGIPPSTHMISPVI